MVSLALQTAHWNAAKTSATCSGIIRFPGVFSSSCGAWFVIAELGLDTPLLTWEGSSRNYMLTPKIGILMDTDT